MADIDIPDIPAVVPTVCAPAEYVKTLTTSQNAITMGEYGAIAGFLAACMMFIGYVVIGPRVVIYGRVRGWWS